MMINRNLTSQIPFGYISAQALDDDIVNELQQRGTDPHYAVALEEAQREAANDDEVQAEFVDSGGVTESQWEDADEDECFSATFQWVKDNWSGSRREQEFNDSYQPDEPIHEGEYQGVKYRTSWLGGALNVWVFESPHITHLARQASPCVPGAAILDTLDGNVTGYDVPPEWRRDVS